MGTVYGAGQTEPVKRQVALRLIKIGLDSRAVLSRFDAERQAPALMDHPNIARVYDGRTTAGGPPFFVMELVDGVPISEDCDRRRPSVRARLELFVSVCQAVQHAHQKGIIHRDLKPGNILVTEVDGRPTPKVIDFGVAKATDFKLTDHSMADTGAIVGTPTYMSPEQTDPSSMDIDTRTDVYALGVILYELLAGSPPIDAKQFKRGAFLEMLRMVREVDPPRPSTKVSSAEALPSVGASPAPRRQSTSIRINSPRSSERRSPRMPARQSSIRGRCAIPPWRPLARQARSKGVAIASIQVWVRCRRSLMAWPTRAVNSLSREPGRPRPAAFQGLDRRGG
jgi:serine/threonine protein kinase